LTQFKHLAGAGKKAGKPPINITNEERQAFDVVQKEDKRLEQEKIPPTVVAEWLKRCQ
jgi:hypothetical protein